MESLATVLSSVGTFFTSAIGWLGEVMTVVESNPILFIMVAAIPIAGVAIGYCQRLFRLG